MEKLGTEEYIATFVKKGYTYVLIYKLIDVYIFLLTCIISSLEGFEETR